MRPRPRRRVRARSGFALTALLLTGAPLQGAAQPAKTEIAKPEVLRKQVVPTRLLEIARRPDLVASLSLTPKSATPNQRVTITTYLYNVGNADAIVADPINLVWRHVTPTGRLSPLLSGTDEPTGDARPDDTGVRVVHRETFEGEIAERRRKPIVSFNFTVPAAADTGVHRICVFIDPEKRFDDGSATNNVRCSILSVDFPVDQIDRPRTIMPIDRDLIERPDALKLPDDKKQIQKKK